MPGDYDRDVASKGFTEGERTILDIGIMGTDTCDKTFFLLFPIAVRRNIAHIPIMKEGNGAYDGFHLSFPIMKEEHFVFGCSTHDMDSQMFENALGCIEQ